MASVLATEIDVDTFLWEPNVHLRNFSRRKCYLLVSFIFCLFKFLAFFSSVLTVTLQENKKKATIVLKSLKNKKKIVRVVFFITFSVLLGLQFFVYFRFFIA